MSEFVFLFLRTKIKGERRGGGGGRKIGGSSEGEGKLRVKGKRGGQFSFWFH